MTNENYIHTDLTEQIIRAAYDVFDELGNGFLESVYEKAFEIALKEYGLDVIRQAAIPVYYYGEQVGDFKADLIVDGTVIIELKAVEKIQPIHEAQIINYLRATRIEIGLIINFGEKLQIKRRVFANSRKKNFRNT